MRVVCRLSGAVLLLTLQSVAVPVVSAQGGPARQESVIATSKWLDVNGEPLPFQDDVALLEALRSATLSSREPLSRPGLAHFEMLVLEHRGARFFALFRPQGEAAKLEVAAYVVDRLLHIHRVPPVVVRSIGGDSGTVQIWRQHAGTELEIDQAGSLIPPDARDFGQQRQTVYLFDNLIANPGRSQENTVIDPDWRIWLIDHAGAFQETTDLLNQLELTKCDRSLWRRLQELDKSTLKDVMAPHLDKKQVARLVTRHRNLVRHIQEMITTFGEGVVLFDGVE